MAWTWRQSVVLVWIVILLCILAVWGTCSPPGAEAAPLPFNYHSRFLPGVYYAGASTYLRLAADGTASVDDVWISGLGRHAGTWRERGPVIRVEQHGSIREFLKEDLRQRE
jgi:predicted small integral membrane protein